MRILSILEPNINRGIAMKRFAFFVFALMIVEFSAEAKVFRNAYISFEMPETWRCNLEVTEWVCRSDQGKESKEAIIILTAKEVGPTDTFPLYEQHLNNPITIQTRGGGRATSQVVYKAKNVSIHEQPWMDGLHLGSEVPNYFTRYLATIKDRIAVLVTLSAHKNYYDRYSNEFFKTVMSLRVIATKELLARPGGESGVRGSGEQLGWGTQGAHIGDALDDGLGGEGSSGKGGKAGLIVIALALAGIGTALYLRKKRRK